MSQQTFNTGGGPLSIGANQGSGTQRVEAHALVQQMIGAGASAQQADALERVFAYAKTLNQEHGPALTHAVEDYAKTKDQGALSRITETLKNVRDSASYGTEIAAAATPLLALIASLFS